MPAPVLALALALVAPPAAAGDDYAAVLATHTGQGAVDYAAIQSTKALDGVLAAWAQATEPAEADAKRAFWINAYNGLTIDMMADEWPVQSITALDGGKVWDARRFTVAGRSVSLNDIEHKILRPMSDARVHAAINCASAGCPPLSSTPFSATGLASQLDRASARWISGNGMRREASAVTFNKIFDWYGEDFVKEDDCGIVLAGPSSDKKLSAAACFASKHTDPETAAWLRAGGYTASFHAYSWRPNAR